jgi:putative acetyltransferase
MTLAIRPTPPDHPQVLALIAELDAYLAALYDPEDVYIVDLAGLMEPSVTFLGAWSGDVLVGCGAVRLMPAEPGTDGQPYGEIKRMFVSPARRGERIGQQVLDALELDLQQRGIGRALLETGPPQVEALRLYARCGYARRAAFGGYPDKATASVFMEKRWKTD